MPRTMKVVHVLLIHRSIMMQSSLFSKSIAIPSSPEFQLMIQNISDNCILRVCRRRVYLWTWKVNIACCDVYVNGNGALETSTLFFRELIDHSFRLFNYSIDFSFVFSRLVCFNVSRVTLQFNTLCIC